MRTKHFLPLAVLALGSVFMAGCQAGNEGTEQDKANLERLSEEGMSAPSNAKNFQQPGQPAAPGQGQSMNPPPPDYQGE